MQVERQARWTDRQTDREAGKHESRQTDSKTRSQGVQQDLEGQNNKAGRHVSRLADR